MLQPAALDFVVAVSTHPRNWKWVSEDGQDPANFVPPPRLYFAHGEQGYVAVERLGAHTWAFHITMLPKAKEVAKFTKSIMDAIVLIFGAKKFLASIPTDNKACCRLARSLGAKEEGRLTKSFYRNGKMNDVIVFGMVVDDD